MYTRRIVTSKLQLLIVKSHLSAQNVISHFDLTCTTNFYDFGYNVIDDSSLYINHLPHLISQRMEISQSYIKWMRDKGLNETLTMANIARIRKVCLLNINYGNKHF
jgi:hypothetical protein